MARTLGAEVWQPCQAVLGEGPNWDERTGWLSWVDVLSSVVHVADAEGSSVADFELSGHVGAALPAAEGGWLVALPDRLAHLGSDGRAVDVTPLEADLPTNRANDAKCDPSGRAWVGTMSYDEGLVAGALYRADVGPTVSGAGLVPATAPVVASSVEMVKVLGDVGIANGLAWSPGHETMYFIDTVTHEVRAYPFDIADGRLGIPTTVVGIDPSEGYPDGMCSDDDGCLWVALFAGGCVRRYTPAGALDMEVRLPVTYTTSCCFGGSRRDLLFITTARRDLDEEGKQREPMAGSVWVARPGVTGPAATPWRR